MKIIHTEQYEKDGRKYEIRLYGSAWEFTVQAFINGKRANGYSYSVSLPTAIDLNTVHRLDAVKVLMDAAKRDIADRVWEQYVDAYIKTLQKTEEQALGCRKCGEREITVSIVDERKMYECGKCGNVWYESRKMTSPYLTEVDSITEGVEHDGFYEIDTFILLNGAFRPDAEGPSFVDQLQNWSLQNRLRYENVQKDGRPHVRFSRARKYTHTT
jgi:DNA-directed RNA polymerase subunit M/transcription elongation factor TFIIS